VTTSIRIVHVADTHLSATHAYFQDNWAAVRSEILAAQPDLVVHGGDVSFNGPANAGDLAYARTELDRLGVPWKAVAGNHDIGEAPPFSRLAQPLTDERIGAWRGHVGPMWWQHDIGEWRLVGLDTALMASGRPEEADQTAFLAEALGTRGKRPVMVFVHMPPFKRRAEDAEWTTSSIPHPARGPFLDACAEGGVKVIACGHLHVHHRMKHRGMDIVWAPATAMVDSGKRITPRATSPRPGFLLWELEGRRARHTLVEPQRAFIIDMTGWTLRNGGTTTTLPPLPLRPTPATP
jgi:3',5'-cyclic AMP phosphodiesterase CpdA